MLGTIFIIALLLAGVGAPIYMLYLIGNEEDGFNPVAGFGIFCIVFMLGMGIYIVATSKNCPDCGNKIVIGEGHVGGVYNAGKAYYDCPTKVKWIYAPGTTEKVPAPPK